MARTGCEKEEWTRKGPWTFVEDMKLRAYVSLYGAGSWSFSAKDAGLKRSGKSCRIRWLNYLRPGLKRGRITPEEKQLIIGLQRKWGNRWSEIAKNLPGRTDNEIKNYWKSHIKKKCPELMGSFSWPTTSKCAPQIKAVEEITAPSKGQNFNTQPLSSLENSSLDSNLPAILNQNYSELYNCCQASLALQQQEEDSEAFSLYINALRDMGGCMVQDSPLSFSCSIPASPLNYFPENDILWDYNSLLLWNLDDDAHSDIA